MFDFDLLINREGSNCEKYDNRLAKFGNADVIPLWVADMDFTAPPCVQEALLMRLQHGVFGYSFAPDSLYESVQAWFLRRHQWQIQRDDILLTAGVVPSLFATIQALTDVHDEVIVSTPVYPPFFSAVQQSSRTLVINPLKHTAQGYQFDFELLKRQAKTAKMLLLCNPHNPVGRVWLKEELQQLIEIALENQLTIVSDDIHCDLVYAEHKYLPLAHIAPADLRLITTVSPSKSFNIPGLNLSALITNAPADKKAIARVFNRLHVNPFNPLSMTAFEAAYSSAEPWLEALLVYLQANRDYVSEQLQRTTSIQCTRPEATALMWLDCRAMGLDDAQLKDFFVQKAGLGLNDGLSFGTAGAGFMRLNIGTRRAVLAQAMTKLHSALGGR